jgi:hypothetical protein
MRAGPHERDVNVVLIAYGLTSAGRVGGVEEQKTSNTTDVLRFFLTFVVTSPFEIAA